MNKDISELVLAVKKGESSAIDAYTTLTEIKKEIEAHIAAIKEYAIKEAEKYPKKFNINGYEYQLSEGRAIYDYKHIEEWVEKNKEIKEIEEKAKAAAIQHAKGLNLIDVNGEIIQPCIIKYSEPFLTIKKINNGK
jgi:hypothetical protein